MIDLELDFPRYCGYQICRDDALKFHFVAGLREDISAWCEESLAGSYEIHADWSVVPPRYWLAFEHASDAVLFKLRWF